MPRSELVARLATHCSEIAFERAALAVKALFLDPRVADVSFRTGSARTSAQPEQPK